VKEIGESIRLVDVDDDLLILKQVRDVLLFEHSLRYFLKRDGDESVQLLGELKILVSATAPVTMQLVPTSSPMAEAACVLVLLILVALLGDAFWACSPVMASPVSCL
jgi:hypothetical protein